MLHTVLHSPFQCDFTLLLQLLKRDDDLLLLQDAVIAGVKGSRPLALLEKSPATLYALRDDIEARGLVELVSSSISVIDYSDFVGLTVKQTQQMSW